MIFQVRTAFAFLFMLLSMVTIAIAAHFHQIDEKTSQLRANTLAEQLSTTLEVISADRVRSINELANNWPTSSANQVDWFNYQSRSLMKILPGISDIWLSDANGNIVWTIMPASRPGLISQYLPDTLQQIQLATQTDTNQLVQFLGRKQLVYSRPVVNAEQIQWDITALIDIQATLDALTLDLQEKPVALRFAFDGIDAYSFGTIQTNYPVAKKNVSFAGFNATLSIQSHEQTILNLTTAIVIGELISLLICMVGAAWMLNRQKSLHVRQLYQSAANVSPDAILIFASSSGAFEQLEVFDFNKKALEMMKATTDELKNYTIDTLCADLGLPELKYELKNALANQNSLSRLIKTKNTRFSNHWTQLAVLSIPDGMAVTLQDVTSEKQMQERIQYQAEHDQLTGLLNRYAFSKKLDMLLESKQHGYLCYIDMDHFKQINDSCGHIAGDELLRKTSGLLASYLSANDSIARVGGDEFCILIGDRNRTEVETLLEALLAAISQFRFSWENQTFVIGASIGVVEITPGSGDVQALLKAADSGCYLAKNAGRNSFYFVELESGELNHLEQERHFAAIVRRSLAKNSFELYAQPIFPLCANDGMHVEVLIRLRDDSHNFISPAVFIPLAEKLGLMKQIDEWVVKQVLCKIENEFSQLKNLEKIAINISAISLSDSKFLKSIKKAIKNSMVPADMLCFEITETAAVSNLAQAQLFIQELRQLGCSFALDDFGVGMSSFGYLKNMPVDYVKIDGSFVKNMVNNTTDAVLVKAITDIAHSLEKKAIAEFVQDQATCEMLRSFGVEFAQGYGLGVPKPIDLVLSELFS